LNDGERQPYDGRVMAPADLICWTVKAVDK